jgi:NADP-dependent 3-hydroxy acid dehydrogenase YdfG
MMATEYDLRRWRERVAVVTGASSGIGEAVAERLAAAGVRVVATGRRLESLQALAARVDGEVMPVVADLREEDEIATLFSKVRGRWGGADLLVNAAGLGYLSPLMSGDAAVWREMLEVNVLALCVCTREAIKDMRERGDRGHIVHVSSIAGHRVPSDSGVYSATKFAVRSLTEGLRRELYEAGSSIRVSAVSPGLVDTEFAEKYYGTERRGRAEHGRMPMLAAGDVADAILFAISQPPHVQVHDVIMRPIDQRT